MQSPRKCYRTIKALVFDFVHGCDGRVDYEALTKQVHKHFPTSKWKKTHWTWYRYQIVHGRFRKQFSDQERANLAPGATIRAGEAPAPAVAGSGSDMPPLARGPRPRDPEVKRIGDAVLNHARLVISEAAGDDMDLRFKLNRWVFSRLLQDETRVKRPIKKKLWESGMRTCQACGEPFASLRGTELHRKNADLGYALDNCELLCRECHQEISSSDAPGNAIGNNRTTLYSPQTDKRKLGVSLLALVRRCVPTPDYYESWSSPLQRYRWPILIVAIASWLLPFATVLGNVFSDFPPRSLLPLVLGLSLPLILLLWAFVLIPHFFHPTEGWFRARDADDRFANIVLVLRWVAAFSIDGLLLLGLLIASFVLISFMAFE